MPPPDCMIDGTVPEDDPFSLSLLFHLNSEPWLNSVAYDTGGHAGEPLDLSTGPRHVLPPAGESALTRLLASRRSCRTYEPRTMPLATAGALVHAAGGITERVVLDEGIAFHRRGAPSAGGLFPLDVYAFTQRVDTLPEGVYRYDHLAHSLVEIARGELASQLAPALYAYPFVHAANVVLAFVAQFARTQTKYGPRGYRYILLEAGHCAQDVALRAAELGLGCLCIGGFLDGEMNRSLGLTLTQAGIVYMVAAGYPQGADPPTTDHV